MITGVMDDIPFLRSMILTVILLLPSNPLEPKVSSPKLLLELESMDMRDVDNGTYDVAVEADGAIDIEEAPYLSWIQSLQSVMVPSE